MTVSTRSSFFGVLARSTYAHIAASYGIHESNLYRLVKWVEDVLIKGDTFSPPGKKVSFDDETDYDIVLLDSTETPIERPQKNSVSGIVVKRNATP